MGRELLRDKATYTEMDELELLQDKSIIYSKTLMITFC